MIDERAWLETRHEAIGLLISAAQARAIIEAYEAAKESAQPVELPPLEVDRNGYSDNERMRLCIMEDCYNCHKYEPMSIEELLLMESNVYNHSEKLEKLRYLLIDQLRSPKRESVCLSPIDGKEVCFSYKADSEKQNGWIPIETAPKDGERVLLFQNGGPLGVQIIVGWRSDWFYRDEHSPKVAVTHWMPLPKPPLSKIENGNPHE